MNDVCSVFIIRLCETSSNAEWCHSWGGEATHCKTSVSSLMACTATSYSLSRVIDTMRSCQWEQTYVSDTALYNISCHIKCASLYWSGSPWSDLWRAPVVRRALCCRTNPAELSGTSAAPHLARATMNRNIDNTKRNARHSITVFDTKWHFYSFSSGQKMLRFCTKYV